MTSPAVGVASTPPDITKVAECWYVVLALPAFTVHLWPEGTRKKFVTVVLGEFDTSNNVPWTTIGVAPAAPCVIVFGVSRKYFTLSYGPVTVLMLIVVFTKSWSILLGSNSISKVPLDVAKNIPLGVDGKPLTRGSITTICAAVE